MQTALDLRPEIGELFTEFYGRLWSDQLVEPVLLELCRLRIAQLLGDRQQAMVRYEGSDGRRIDLDEAKIADLARYSSSSHFTEHERICLNYAEQYVIDVHSITDDDVALVKRGMSDAEFVAFSIALGMLEAVGRFRLTLGLSGRIPDQPSVVAAPAPGRPAP